MRVDHRWPGRPTILPEESFSSWFARTAVANGQRPGELYRIVQPGEDRNPRDLDRYADDHLIHRLAECTERELRAPAGRQADSDELLAAKRVLRGRGQPATRRNLVQLMGAKPAALDQVTEPAVTDCAPWGKGRYWKLDGVSPEVKAAARIAAHRAGEGVGPWLDALLRRELGIPAHKTPCARQSPDTFAADGISGCAE